MQILDLQPLKKIKNNNNSYRMQLLVVLRAGYQLHNATLGQRNVVGSSKKGGLCIQLNRQKYINPIDDLTKDVFVPIEY